MAASLGDRIRSKFEQLVQTNQGSSTSNSGDGSKETGEDRSHGLTGSASNRNKNVSTGNSNSSGRTGSTSSGPETQTETDIKATEEIDFPPLPTTVNLLNAHKEKEKEKVITNASGRVDPSWGVNIQDAEIQAVLEEINKIEPPGDLGDVPLLPLDDTDCKLLKVRLEQLRSASVILHTPDSCLLGMNWKSGWNGHFSRTTTSD
ncbi:hypothetical protein R1sor_012463 [Riccia sorocarpa]|uniref:Uncharacterized protein n=1 Tax=Riccia sorocarpa TaxID=122646 RepID=A0ABD3I3V1_9MARC